MFCYTYFVKKNIFFLGIITICNLFVTFYAWNSVPHNLAYDEILLAKLALSLGRQAYTPFSTLADGHATPYFYLLLSSFKLFGITNTALRLPSALCGFIGVFVFYGICKLIFKKKDLFFLPLSFVVTLIFTFLRWRITFIRFSFEMPYLLLLELLSTYFLFLHKEKKQPFLLVLSGVFAGLAFNSYQPGRIFFLVPLIFLFIQKERIKNILYFIIPFMIFIIPLSAYIVTHAGSDSRVDQLGYLTKNTISISTKFQYGVSNITKTALMFVYRGDANGRHNFPYKAALNPILSILLLGGFFIFMFKKRNPYDRYFFVYFCIALIPALLTLPGENPHMLRTYTVIVPAVYFVGTVLRWLEEIKLKTIFAFLVLGLLCFSSFYELRTYFYYQARVTRNSFEVTCSLDKVVLHSTSSLGDLPKECRVGKNLF